MSDFQLTLGCKGYVTKPDLTATDELFLVSGSRNVLINDQEKVESSPGYTLFADASTSGNGVKSQAKWTTNRGDETLIRESNGTLEFYSEVSDDFETLLTGLSATFPVRFATIWDGTELIDALLFVNHSSSLYSWSGARGTYASATSNTITINETIGEEGFWTAGTREIRVKDSGGTWRTFAYTGISGSQFTGVTPDPTAFTFLANAIVVQAVRTTATTPASGFTNDFIKVLENQVYVGSASSRVLYISKNTSYTDFSKSTPRLPGEGATVTLDDVCRGLETDDEQMFVFSGDDLVYFVDFLFTAGSAADRETVKVKPIVSGSNQGAISQELITNIKSSIVYINKNNELVELIKTEQGARKLADLPISYPIEPDFISANFTNGHMYFWKNSIHISAPGDSKSFIYNISKKFWQPPQILPVRLFSDYNGSLIGHSNSDNESYTLYDSTRARAITGDDTAGTAISHRAFYAYRNGGERDMLKNFNLYFLEMYMTSNTEFTHRILYEYGGAKAVKEFTYRGSETAFIFSPTAYASLGVNSLGITPLGTVLSEPDELLKYRRIKKIVPTDFFEFQAQFECETLDARFAILAHGPAMKISSNKPVKITN